jgi:hypothetical protein
VNEQSILIFLIIGLVVAIFIGFAILSWRLERKRLEALAGIASRLGFTFSEGADRDLAQRFRDFRGLNTGENRYAWSVLTGHYLDRQITAFDFHYETSTTDSKGNRSTQHHYLHIVVLQLDRALPSLFIAPEGFFSKIAQAFGYDDIDFESHEFSRRFCVRSADRKFAYDFCNASMIDFLLDNPNLRLETRDGVLAAVFDEKMDPQIIESEISLVCSIRDRMPDYLFANA